MNRRTFARLCRHAVPTLFSLALPFATPALAAVITVDTTADADVADSDCSLREAIVAANGDAAYNGCAAGSGVDRIQFSLTPPATITLTADLPVISASAGIVGLGMNDLTIDGADSYVLIVFDTPTDNGTFFISGLTLAHGWGPDDFNAERGGGATVGKGETATFYRVKLFENRGENGGGGLRLASELPHVATAVLHECVVEGNDAEGPTGGGGILTLAGSNLTITKSTITGNLATAVHGNGAGMRLTASTTTIRRSTISGNLANDSGGGILLYAFTADPNSLTLTDSTIAANQSAVTNSTGTGAGLLIALSAVPVTNTTLTLRNTIIAANIDNNANPAPDVYTGSSTGLTVTSNGFNLIGSNASFVTLFTAGSPNANGDFVGTSAAPLLPLLAALDDNGGPTPTHLPVENAASLTIDHGECFTNAADQRGFVDAVSGLRPVDNATVANHANSDTCDIGAVELGAVASNEIFADGFESGTTFAWAFEAPV